MHSEKYFNKTEAKRNHGTSWKIHPEREIGGS